MFTMYIYRILEIDPCGEDRPFVVQAATKGFIDSSVLMIRNNNNVNCSWLIEVKRNKRLTITPVDVKLDKKYVIHRHQNTLYYL